MPAWGVRRKGKPALGSLGYSDVTVERNQAENMPTLSHFNPVCLVTIRP